VLKNTWFLARFFLQKKGPVAGEKRNRPYKKGDRDCLGNDSLRRSKDPLWRIAGARGEGGG